MAETNKIVLTEGESLQFSETVRRLLMNGVDIRFLYAAMFISAAIREHCTCSTAEHAPRKIGSAYARRRIKEPKTVTAIAGRFAACRGMSEETVLISPEKIDKETGGTIPQREMTVDMCHYPPDAPNELV